MCFGFAAALSEIWAAVEVVEVELLPLVGDAGDPTVELPGRVVAVETVPLLPLVAVPDEEPVAEEAPEDAVELSAKTPPCFVAVTDVVGDDAWFFNGPAQ